MPPECQSIAAQLDALLRSQSREEEPGVFTTPELAQSLGCSESTAQRKVRAWMQAGLVEPTRKRIAGMDGRVQPVPAYRRVI